MGIRTPIPRMKISYPNRLDDGYIIERTPIETRTQDSQLKMLLL